MLQRFRTVPNQLSGLRLLLIPVLWGFALADLPFYVGVGMVLAGLTDVVDGFIARRFNQVTEFGAKIDSLADNLLIPSAVIWLVMLRPEVFTDHPAIPIGAISVYVASITVGLVKHRRFANLHLYLSKFAGIVEYLFIVHAFLSDMYHPVLFYAAFGLFALASTEALLLQVTQAEVDEHMGSLVLVLLGDKMPRLGVRRG